MTTFQPDMTSENDLFFKGIYDRFIDDAAFLWVLRAVAVRQPHYDKEELAELEERLQAQLNGLMSSVELGWAACEEALKLEGPGEVFSAAVTAFRSHEVNKIKQVVDAGLQNESTLKGLISALGWLSPEMANPWIEKFLISKDLDHKCLGLAACSVRRHDPADYLATLLQRDDCLQHTKLHARALRLIGELRRQDLMPALSRAMSSDQPAIAFWANWSAILLGNKAALKNLQPYLFKPGPYQQKAINIAFRVLPIEEARDYITAMAQDETLNRAVIRATGVLGDPHAVNWLITKMREPQSARLAGEAFTMITGIDLAHNQLSQLPPAIDLDDESGEDNVAMDEDEHLLWPDAEKVTRLWQQRGRHFIVGQRYFMGQTINSAWLLDMLANAKQRQRQGAALELALTDPAHNFYNTQARVAN